MRIVKELIIGIAGIGLATQAQAATYECHMTLTAPTAAYASVDALIAKFAPLRPPGRLTASTDGRFITATANINGFAWTAPIISVQGTDRIAKGRMTGEFPGVVDIVLDEGSKPFLLLVFSFDTGMQGATKGPCQRK